ncbi:MAG: hypothetical protein ACTHL1_01755 [Burkholderiaceae bacterium]
MVHHTIHQAVPSPFRIIPVIRFVAARRVAFHALRIRRGLFVMRHLPSTGYASACRLQCRNTQATFLPLARQHIDRGDFEPTQDASAPDGYARRNRSDRRGHANGQEARPARIDAEPGRARPLYLE